MVATTPGGYPVTSTDPVNGTWIQNGIRIGNTFESQGWGTDPNNTNPNASPAFFSNAANLGAAGALLGPYTLYNVIASAPSTNAIAASQTPGAAGNLTLNNTSSTAITGVSYCYEYGGEHGLLKLDTPSVLYWTTSGAVTNAPVLTVMGFDSSGNRVIESVTLTATATGQALSTTLYAYVYGVFVTSPDTSATAVAANLSLATGATLSTTAQANICRPQAVASGVYAFADGTAYRLNYPATITLPGTNFGFSNVLELDVARAVNVNQTGGTLRTYTIFGADKNGQLMQEKITPTVDGTAKAGLKAFKYIYQISVSGAVGTSVLVGTTDIFGLPYYCDDLSNLVNINWNEATPSGQVNFAGGDASVTIADSDIAAALGTVALAAAPALSGGSATAAAANTYATAAPISVTSITVVAPTTIPIAAVGDLGSSRLTATVASTASLVNGQVVKISGATVAGTAGSMTANDVNIAAPITIVNGTTFTFNAARLPTTDQTIGGTITATPIVITTALSGNTTTPSITVPGDGGDAEGTVTGTADLTDATGTFVAGVSTFATYTTGDVRGTFLPGGTLPANASRLAILQAVPGALYTATNINQLQGVNNYPTNTPGAALS